MSVRYFSPDRAIQAAGAAFACAEDDMSVRIKAPRFDRSAAAGLLAAALVLAFLLI